MPDITRKCVSLVVPVYNEAQHLQVFIEQLDALSLRVEKELVFIDDCSKDSSFEILSAFKFKSRTVIHRHDVNQGKGAAVCKGIQLATGDIIGVQDADFEYSMHEIDECIAPILDGKADIVYGSRFKKSGIQVHRTFHYLVNRILTMLSNMFSGLYLTDMETCFKFFKAEIIKNVALESRRFGFEPEITAKVAKLKVRVAEIPISYFPRSYIEGKKITWKDGVAALRHIVVFNFFRKSSDYFKPEMPKMFIPSGRQLL